MKVTARIAETGQIVHAASDTDWRRVHGNGRRNPELRCPEKSCHCKMRAVQLQNRSGTVTRYFAFLPRSHRCSHAAVSAGVTAGETLEHRWLKARVWDFAARDGYQPHLEYELPGGARADIYIEGVQRGSRIEIQRGKTDIDTRTHRHPDVVWLLRSPYSRSCNHTEALLSQPCVMVRVTAFDGRKEVAAEPWSEGYNGPSVQIMAADTVLNRVAEDLEFEPKSIPLPIFLRQVWSGQRQWYAKGQAHSGIAGWALTADVEAVSAARERRRYAEHDKRVEELEQRRFQLAREHSRAEQPPAPAPLRFPPPQAPIRSRRPQEPPTGWSHWVMRVRAWIYGR